MLFPSPIIGNERQFLGVVVLRVGLHSAEFILDGVRRSLGPRSSAARAEYVLLANDRGSHDSLVLYDSAQPERVEERYARMDGATLSAFVKPGYHVDLHSVRKGPVVTGYAPVNRYGQ